MLTYGLLRIRGRMLTNADVCAVAHRGRHHPALHTGGYHLCRYSDSIKALLRPFKGRILPYTQA